VALPTEKEIIASWMKDHEGELPSMNSGLRIHGDPIIYMGSQPPDYLKSMQVIEEDEKPEAAPRQIRSRLTVTELLRDALISAGATMAELEVCYLRAPGINFRQIAKAMNLSIGTIHNIHSGYCRKLRSPIKHNIPYV